MSDTSLLGDVLTTGTQGWYMVLDSDERVVTDAFSLSGVTIFSSYRPDIAILDASGDPISNEGSCSDKKFIADTENFCSKTGNSRLFVVNTTNGFGLQQDDLGARTRYREVSTLVSQPYTEQGTNNNSPGDGGDDADFGDLTDFDVEVMDTLKGLFPTECHFASYRIDVKTVSADTSLQRIAAIPVCLIEKNWREF